VLVNPEILPPPPESDRGNRLQPHPDLIVLVSLTNEPALLPPPSERIQYAAPPLDQLPPSLSLPPPLPLPLERLFFSACTHRAPAPPPPALPRADRTPEVRQHGDLLLLVAGLVWFAKERKWGWVNGALHWSTRLS
jgi:hypothetical protein